MIRSSLQYTFILGTIALFCSGTVFAQNRPSPDGPPDAAAANQQRPNLLQELGLTADQLQQIRNINRTRKPLMDQALRRLQDANRNLDAAIYADTLDENEVQMRLKEFHEAQAAVARLRFTSELQIRRVLTPDQLVHFRELRARFAAMMIEQRQRRRQNRRKPTFGGQPNQFKPN